MILKSFKKKVCRETSHSSLTGKKITEKEYELVLKVWNVFEMKTMKNYHNLFLKCDVLLLADLFEKFKIVNRNGNLQNYGLCCIHY